MKKAHVDISFKPDQVVKELLAILAEPPKTDKIDSPLKRLAIAMGKATKIRFIAA